jgi:hypothetical protein
VSVLKLAGEISREILSAFLLNYLFVFIYITVIMFFRFQYQKYSDLQTDVYGKPAKTLREITEKIILTGLIAGFAGSFATVAAGVTIEPDAVRGLFYLMCILMLFNLRFACISYAAGILASVSLAAGVPKIDIPSLLGLTALLQVIESILIFITRKDDCIPVYLRKNDEITGAFVIRRFWLIPIVFFSYLLQNSGLSLDVSSNSPLIFGAQSLKNSAYALGLDCFIAVLCYGDIAITRHPEKKCTQNAAAMLCYSLVLMLIAVISVKISWLRYAGTVFCILGHEVVRIWSERVEKRGKPIYNAVRRGLRVLDVLPDSHARKMGMERGDIILSINNHDIQTEEGVAEALREFPSYTWIRVINWKGEEKTLEYRCFPGGYNNLGIITVPREKEVTYNTGYFENMSIVKNIVNRFRGVDGRL